ncbi:MAG: flagellar basal-body rod protein FlgG [Hyphomonadaceae bacterium]|nr:MAG: flagellar basal-body rod protein FlgG [Caulobacteraceae bacterium]MBT9447309.1 flagellar basal-body rod protein FlgG [Hyphomonadaceae bacterium]TPW08280.1 MAG: flagellar basal-body rod protein FlgG [Alphaproteobacteria bacterium]
MRSLSIAATGMQAQQLNVEVISNNIANMNTTGFKRQRAEFQDLLYQNLERPGASTSSSGTIAPNGIQIGVGVKAGAIGRVTEQGSIARTDNPTDLAISGRGYFQVSMPDGTTAYTRDGNLAIDAEGRIVTSDGFPLEPAITVPQEALSVSISRDGVVEAQIQGQSTPQQLGQIELAAFVNPAGLEAQGDNLFLETAASGSPNVSTPSSPGFGTLMQGFVETSNVNAVEEISALIIAQRAYEMNAKVITASDEMLQAATQVR